MLDCDNAIEPAMLSPQGSGYEVMPYVYRELRAASLLQHCPCIHSQVEMSDGKETRGAEQTRISGCAAIIWQFRPRRLAAGKPSEDESKKKGSSMSSIVATSRWGFVPERVGRRSNYWISKVSVTNSPFRNSTMSCPSMIP